MDPHPKILCFRLFYDFSLLNKKEMKAVNEWSYLSRDLQDSDGEAGIALVGVHGEYPKYANDDKLFSDKEGAATVGWVYSLHTCQPTLIQ